jgi:hypothetical protein
MKLLLLIATLSPAALAQVRVEPRALVKDGHFFLSGGAAWLERHDEYSNPGLTLTAAYYLREDDGLEARAAFFASSLTDSAQEVATATGLKPDAQKPVSLLLAGWRHSLTYGKLALGASVVHFDVQSGLYAGALITDVEATPALSAALGVVARLGVHGFAQLDLALVVSRENRSTTVMAVGVLPTFSLGWSL